MTPDLVVVGHLVRDETPHGYNLGGTVTYAAITARNLGYHAAILTRAADIPSVDLLHNVEVVSRSSPSTTTFRNIYQNGHRQQFVHDVAPLIRIEDVPESWRRAKIALLGTVTGEVESEVARIFSPQTLVGVTPQGWLRQWDESGRVRPRPWSQAEAILPHVRVLVLSEEDLGEYAERLQDYIAMTPIVVLTRGPRGCTVYQKGQPPFDSPAFRANEVDPTGAGDVFTSAFLIRLYETGDVVDAARFANCTASFAIEAEGVAGIPTREMVERRLYEGELIK